MSFRIPKTSKNAKTVAIIGAGVSGLCVAKYLLEERLAASEHPNEEIFQVVIFEQNAKAGGVWNQTEADVPFATPMYPACTSIVPTDMMQYSGLPYPKTTALFPKNPSVARYLHEYASDLEERQVIEYNTKVLHVCRRLTPDSDQLKWEVKICQRRISGCENEEVRNFDFLILALGTFTKEYIPPLFDSPRSDIKILHSKQYRTADQFTGKRVLIVGDGPASLEMSEAISKVCEGKLFLSVKEPEKFKASSKIENQVILPEVTKLRHATKKVHFENGRKEKVDIILLCTGYTYDFKMIPCVQMTEDKKRVLGLYEHMIYIDETVEPTIAPDDILQAADPLRSPYEVDHCTGDPSLAIIGLPTMNSVFLVAEAQSAFIARYFSGRIRIPVSQMKEERDAKAKVFDLAVARGEMRNAQFHTLVYPRDAEYVDELFRKCLAAEVMGTGKLPQFHTLKLHWIRDNMDAIRTTFKSAGETESKENSTVESLWWLHWIRDRIPIAFMGIRGTKFAKFHTLKSLGFNFDESTTATARSAARHHQESMLRLQKLMEEKNTAWTRNYQEWESAADGWKEMWDWQRWMFRAWEQHQLTSRWNRRS